MEQENEFGVLPRFVLVYGQCPLFSKALGELTGTRLPGSRIYVTSDPEEAIEHLKTRRLEFVLMDLDGCDTELAMLREIKAAEPTPHCVVLITDGMQPALMTAIRLQADGFLSKRLGVQELASQIARAAAGEMVISDSLTTSLAMALRRVPTADEGRDISCLSPRETDVLLCLSNGLSNRQISEQLKISDGTVKVHVKHVLKKLGFASRVEAALWASETGHKSNLAKTREKKAA